MGVRALAICDVVVGWSRRFDKHPRSSAKDWMCVAHTVIIEYFAVINPMSRRQDESRIYFRAIPIVDTRTYILHIRRLYPMFQKISGQVLIEKQKHQKRMA
jgi:hypothetical protein